MLIIQNHCKLLIYKGLNLFSFIYGSTIAI